MRNYLLTAALTFSGMFFSAYGSDNMFEDLFSKGKGNFEELSKKMDGMLKSWSVEDFRKVFTNPTIMRDLGNFSVVDPKEYDRFIAFLKERDLFGKQFKDAFNKAWGVFKNDVEAFNSALEDMNQRAQTAASAESGNKRLKIRVETLHRIASDNAACLQGCRILGENVIESAGSPDRLGKFIARAMIADAREHVRTSPFLSSRRALSVKNSLSVMNRELLSEGHFDIDKFIGVVQKLRDNAIEFRNMVQQIKNNIPFSFLDRVAVQLDESSGFRVIKMERTLKSAKTYKKALNARTGFILKAFSKENGKLDVCGISIKKLLGGALGGALAVQVSSEEYDIFHSAVEMERDRLLTSLQNSDYQEDRDFAREIYSEIEAELTL